MEKSITLSDTWKCYDWFQGKPEQRIINWRRYRQQLNDDHLTQVAKIWATCPLVNNYLEFDDCQNWPDAWQLISTGIYCEAARGLGMFYTLTHSSYRHADTLMLNCYVDQQAHRYLNLVICPVEKYMLNYNLGAVVNISALPQTARLRNSYQYKDLAKKR